MIDAAFISSSRKSHGFCTYTPCTRAAIGLACRHHLVGGGENERRWVRPPFIPERCGRGRRRSRSEFSAETFRSAAQGRRGRAACASRSVRIPKRGRGRIRRGRGGPHD